MIKVGETPDGRDVVSGIFKLFDTSGLPPSVIFELCMEKNLQPSFIHFYDEATVAGWKHKTIILRLREALGDSHGTSYAEEVVKRLEEYGTVSDS